MCPFCVSLSGTTHIYEGLDILWVSLLTKSVSGTISYQLLSVKV